MLALAWTFLASLEVWFGPELMSFVPALLLHDPRCCACALPEKKTISPVHVSVHQLWLHHTHCNVICVQLNN